MRGVGRDLVQGVFIAGEVEVGHPAGHGRRAPRPALAAPNLQMARQLCGLGGEGGRPLP